MIDQHIIWLSGLEDSFNRFFKSVVVQQIWNVKELRHDIAKLIFLI